MRINGTNINDIPTTLSSMAAVIASLIEVTNASETTPDIGFNSELISYSANPKVMFEAREGNVFSIWAGGVDISDIASKQTWEACMEEAEEHYRASETEHRQAAAENRHDIARDNNTK